MKVELREVADASRESLRSLRATHEDAIAEKDERVCFILSAYSPRNEMYSHIFGELCYLFKAVC